MAVWLPQVLDIAHQPRIAVIEQQSVAERRFGAGLGITVPARRRAELDVVERKYVIAPGNDAVGGSQAGCRFDCVRREYPRPGRAAKVRRRHRHRTRHAEAANAGGNRALHAPPDFSRSWS